jgi:hypothetical protein
MALVAFRNQIKLLIPTLINLAKYSVYSFRWQEVVNVHFMIILRNEGFT